ncbi:hypothetical protein GPAL_2307 [Glaciecola pallidula DSM 14239 = ACAM 615]|uniref:Uncharacterized protein n=1 Tax=Brumicola pallidula DSM 14239 = ACAM 615 TaxID=1121922 RepID=K6ZJV5_9ALTE|nr:hypothetical protein GPAL_2307 [Glaciecola pallidula DSM 14239 = ACAM 615]
MYALDEMHCNGLIAPIKSSILLRNFKVVEHVNVEAVYFCLYVFYT